MSEYVHNSRDDIAYKLPEYVYSIASAHPTVFYIHLVRMGSYKCLCTFSAVRDEQSVASNISKIRIVYIVNTNTDDGMLSPFSSSPSHIRLTTLVPRPLTPFLTPNIDN